MPQIVQDRDRFGIPVRVQVRTFVPPRHATNILRSIVGDNKVEAPLGFRIVASDAVPKGSAFLINEPKAFVKLDVD